MNQILTNIQNGAVAGKAVFLMVSGVIFVFAVQVIFYLVIKLWPGKGKGG